MSDQNISKKLSRERELAFELLNKKCKSNSTPSSSSDASTGSSNNRARYLDISAWYDDRTTEIQTTPSKFTFEPREISGRSTDFNALNTPGETKSQGLIPSMSLDDLLATSICEDVRGMRRSLTIESDLPRTADISRSTSVSEIDWNAKGFNTAWLNEVPKMDNGNLDSEFLSGEKVYNKILQDQREWEREFADIPSASPKKGDENVFKIPQIPPKGSPNLKPKLRCHVDLSDFSGYLEYAQETSRMFEESRRNFSMGQYFMTNSENLNEMIPNKSPPRREGVPLVDSLSEISWLKETSNNMSSGNDKTGNGTVANKENQNPNYQKLNPDSLSLSTIIRAVKKINLNDDPKTILNKFTEAKQKPPIQASNDTLSEIDQIVKNKFDKEKENCEILSSTIKSLEGLEKTDRFSSSTSINTLNSTESMDTPQKYQQDNRKENMNNENIRTSMPTEMEDSGKGRTLSSNMNMNRVFNTPPSKQCHQRQGENLGSPYSVTSSLERTQDRDRFGAYSSTSPGASGSSMAGKLSLPAYMMAPKSLVRTASEASEYKPTSDRPGRFPLKASCHSLSWQCVKLRESVEKEFTIKNPIDKRVPVYITISGPGFQLKGFSDGGSLKFNPIECRLFTVTFCPTVVGEANGEVRFSLVCNNKIYAVIPLYAFGGKSKIQVHGLTFPPEGIKYLTMGKSSDLNQPMEQYIQIVNKGDIEGFGIIAIGMDSKVFNQNFLPTSLHVHPQRVRLKPNTGISVKITFDPNRDEVRYLLDQKQEVIVITNISVITGDWPTRSCLRSAINLCRDRVEDIASNNILNKIIVSYQNEDFNPSNTTHLIENPLEAVKQCTNTFEHVEFALTVNNVVDEQIHLTSENEQSILFKTMMSKDIPPPSINQEKIDTFPLEITPSTIKILDGHPMILKLQSISDEPQMFEIKSNLKELTIIPNEGYLLPGQMMNLIIQVKSKVLISSSSNIEVRVAQGKKKIEVHLWKN